MASFVYDTNRHVMVDFWKTPPHHIADGAEKCIVKIIEWPSGKFAPLDIHNARKPERSYGLQALYKHFHVPVEFILERTQTVTHSFGSFLDHEKSYVCWAHTLCKNIELHYDENQRPYIRDPRGTRQNNGDWTWLRSGYFLRWTQPFASNPDNSDVTLLIFSPTISLRSHIEELTLRPDWLQGVMDPFSLLVIVAENIFLETSMTINKVLKVLSYTENQVLLAANGEFTQDEFDFVGLHNMSKHVIYLKEGSEAAIALVKHLCEGHRKIVTRFSDPVAPQRLELMNSVQELLLHKVTLLEGLVLRVAGMESRAQNLINLAFNTVNQRDSRSLKADSQAMKVIAVMTMLFLPATAVATIFGSQFFNFDTATRVTITAKNFGVFWIITLPLSVTVVASSSFWPSVKAKIREQKRLVDGAYNFLVIEVPTVMSKITTASRNLIQQAGLRP